jgi:hypothetical protein
MIFLPQPPKFWDYRYAPPCPGRAIFEGELNLPWNLVHPQKSLKTSLEEIELIYS